MVPVVATDSGASPPSRPRQDPVPLARTGCASTLDHAAADDDDATEVFGASPTRPRSEDQHFGDLCVYFHAHADLRQQPCPTDTARKRRRRIYAKVSTDPGNQHGTSKVLLTDSGICAWNDEVVLFVASPETCLDPLRVELLIDIWEIQSELEHDLVGSGRISARSLLQQQADEEKEDATEVTLYRKAGRGFAGRVSVSASLNPHAPLEPLASRLFTRDPALLKGKLLVVALACDGLEHTLQPVLTAAVGSNMAVQRSEVAVWNNHTLPTPSAEGVPPLQPALFVWNHQFSFDVDFATDERVLSFALMDERSASDRELASALLELPEWDSMVPLTASMKSVPMSPSHGSESSQLVRLLLTCCWLPLLPPERANGEDVPTKGSFEETASPVSPPPRSLPLGSTVEVSIHGICEVPQALLDKMIGLDTTCSSLPDKQDLVISGRLLPCGRSSQASMPIAALQLDTQHCRGDAMCARFLPVEDAPSLCFEVAPTVFDSLQMCTEALRVQVELRPKRSRDWRASLCIGLTSFIHGVVGPSGNWVSDFKLLDQDDNFGGRIQASLVCREAGGDGGDGSDHVSRHRSVEMPLAVPLDSATVTLEIQDLKPSNVAASSCSHLFVKIWSSSTGRRHAFKSSTMTWNGAPMLADGLNPSSSAQFRVPDIFSEVFFIQVYRFSRRERNELLGSCSFSLPTQLLHSTRTGTALESENTLVSEWMRLSSSSLPSEGVSNQPGDGGLLCAEILIAMQVEPQMEQSSLDDKRSSQCAHKAATTVLSDATYCSGLRVENRGKLEIELVESYPRTVASAGDSLSTSLRITTSQWSARSSFQDAVVLKNGQGEKKVSWKESYATDVAWSPKERSIPVLQVELFSQRKSLGSPVPPLATSPPPRSVTSSSNPTVKRALNGKSRGGNDTKREQRLGVYNFDLCALFAQPNVWLCLLVLVPVDKSSDSDRIALEEKIPLLMKIRLATLQQTTSEGSSTAVATSPKRREIPRPYPVDGDVCIHLRTASGNFLRRGGEQHARYYVSFCFGKHSVRTSSMPQVEAGVVEWEEHLVLRVNCAAAPILQLMLFKTGSQRAERNESAMRDGSGSGGDPATSKDELIGSLSIPLSPSIIQEKHLLPFTLPIVSQPSNTSSLQSAKQPEFRKDGCLAFEIQFLDRFQDVTSASSNEIVELVIHQMKGLDGGQEGGSGGGGVLQSLSSNTTLQVLLLPSAGPGRKQSEIFLYETNVRIRSGSDSVDVNETIDVTHAMSSIQDHDEGWDLVVQVCDVERTRLGRIHIPLRKGWKERLTRTQKKVWYPVFQNIGPEASATAARIQVSFHVTAAKNANAKSAEELANVAGKLYVQVKEAQLTLRGLDDQMQTPFPPHDGPSAASVQIWVTKQSSEMKRGRTRKTQFHQAPRNWTWLNEVFAIDDLFEDPFEAIRFELVSDQFSGSLIGDVEMARFVRVSASEEEEELRAASEEWITLSSETSTNHCVPLEAKLLLRTTYVPARTGVFEINFGATRSLSRRSSSHAHVPIEKHFMQCTWKRKSYTTTTMLLDIENGNDGARTSPRDTRLEIPFDLRAEDESCRGIPSLAVQWMGFAKAMPEFCVGEFTLDLHAVWSAAFATEKSAGASSAAVRKWYVVHDKHDKSQRTGFVSMSIAFRPRSVLGNQSTSRRRSSVNTGSSMRLLRSLTRVEHRVAASESLVVWKKLFYLLDENGNGRIDLKEFARLFLHHLDALVVSSDGQHLFELLLNSLAPEPPSEKQIQLLFAEMDANNDNEIEWSEYLNFLQRKQHEHDADVCVIDEDDDNDQAQFANLPIGGGSTHRKEMRTKKREDMNTQAPTSRPLPASLQRTTPLGSTRAAQSRGSSSIPPPFPPMASPGTTTKHVSPRMPEAAVVVTSQLAQPPVPSSTERQKSRTSHGGTTSAAASIVRTQYSDDQLDALKSRLQLAEDRLDVEEEEHTHLRHQLTSTQKVLALEQQKYATLSTEYQLLQRNFQLLQLAKQREAIQEEVKAARVKQTIEKHEQLLRDREALRQNHHVASIILQSKMRSRFEQRRFHALKLTRANAATTLQCFARCQQAKRLVNALQDADRLAKKRVDAAVRMQRFVRHHMQRKARGMMMQARQLSAQIVQKYVRRFVGVRMWTRTRRAALTLQCWARRMMAFRLCARHRGAVCRVEAAVHLWVWKRRWGKTKASVRRLQRWWRCMAHKLAELANQNAAALAIQARWRRWQREVRVRDANIFSERFEAAVCIQAMWRGHKTRAQVDSERTHWNLYMERTEAAVCIQATWKRRQQQERLQQPHREHGEREMVDASERSDGSAEDASSGPLEELSRSREDESGEWIENQDAKDESLPSENDEMQEESDESDLSGGGDPSCHSSKCIDLASATSEESTQPMETGESLVLVDDESVVQVMNELLEKLEIAHELQRTPHASPNTKPVHATAEREVIRRSDEANSKRDAPEMITTEADRSVASQEANAEKIPHTDDSAALPADEEAQGSGHGRLETLNKDALDSTEHPVPESETVHPEQQDPCAIPPEPESESTDVVDNEPLRSADGPSEPLDGSSTAADLSSEADSSELESPSGIESLGVVAETASHC